MKRLRIVAVILVIVGISSVASASIFFEDFESYTAGSAIHGQGGWKGWFNDPTYGALTSSVQARSAPNSVDIIGNADLVHEFSGSTSGQWIFTAWQYIPSSFTG